MPTQSRILPVYAMFRELVKYYVLRITQYLIMTNMTYTRDLIFGCLASRKGLKVYKI
jgi:hypothetical protein